MNASPVAAVPAPTAPPLPVRFTVNGNGTVTDTQSGLMWSQATLTPKCVSHHDAVKLADGLALAGHSDWRLPTVEELFLLADRSRKEPAIDAAAFPDTQNDWYWTSTISAWSSGSAWIVYFYGGYANGSLRGGDNGLVRAVRSVPAGQ